MTAILKLADLRWRRRRGPSDVLVGKVGGFWLMVVPRSGREIGKEDPPMTCPTQRCSSRRPSHRKNKAIT